MVLPSEVLQFFKKQGFAIISTMDCQGNIHCSVKGIADITPDGKVYVVDLYCGETYKNLMDDPRVTLSVVDENHFRGYSIQGKAVVIPKNEIDAGVISKWEEAILRRISRRISQSIHSGQKSKGHFEAKLPRSPQSLIVVYVEHVVNLAPSYRNVCKKV